MAQLRTVLPLPSSEPGLRSELERLEREIGHTRSRFARRLLAIERRRVLVALEQLEQETARTA